MENLYGYDELCRIIESCVTETDYKSISECKSLLMIAVNEEVRLKRCVDSLLKERPGMQIVFIAQPSMVPVLKQWYEACPSIAWKGKYTVEVLKGLGDEVRLSHPEGFFYFSEQPVNMRDENFMEIAALLQQQGDVRVFCSTIGEDLYEYHNIHLYCQGIRIYNEINKMIDYM